MGWQKAVRSTAKHGVRAYGWATAAQRPLPDFLVIGAKRAGTTSLYYSLVGHPQIAPMFPSAERFPMKHDQKGVHFFDSEYARGLRWYRAHFPTKHSRAKRERTVAAPVVTGEASPYYLFHPLAAQRAAAAFSTPPRIVVFLRDPVERAFSHYREQFRNGVEKLSFEEAVAAEAERTRGEEARIIADPSYRSFAHEQQTFVGQSEYVRGLRRWFDAFDRSQFLICKSEDFFARPQEAYREVLEHIGVAPLALAEEEPWNAAPNPGLSAETRAELRERLRPSVVELEELLGRSFDWWS